MPAMDRHTFLACAVCVCLLPVNAVYPLLNMLYSGYAPQNAITDYMNNLAGPNPDTVSDVIFRLGLSKGIDPMAISPLMNRGATEQHTVDVRLPHSESYQQTSQSNVGSETNHMSGTPSNSRTRNPLTFAEPRETRSHDVFAPYARTKKTSVLRLLDKINNIVSNIKLKIKETYILLNKTFATYSQSLQNSSDNNQNSQPPRFNDKESLSRTNASREIETISSLPTDDIIQVIVDRVTKSIYVAERPRSTSKSVQQATRQKKPENIVDFLLAKINNYDLYNGRDSLNENSVSGAQRIVPVNSTNHTSEGDISPHVAIKHLSLNSHAANATQKPSKLHKLVKRQQPLMGIPSFYPMQQPHPMPQPHAIPPNQYLNHAMPPYFPPGPIYQSPPQLVEPLNIHQQNYPQHVKSQQLLQTTEPIPIYHQSRLSQQHQQQQQTLSPLQEQRAQRRQQQKQLQQPGQPQQPPRIQNQLKPQQQPQRSLQQSRHHYQQKQQSLHQPRRLRKKSRQQQPLLLRQPQPPQSLQHHPDQQKQKQPQQQHYPDQQKQKQSLQQHYPDQQKQPQQQHYPDQQKQKQSQQQQHELPQQQESLRHQRKQQHLLHQQQPLQQKSLQKQQLQAQQPLLPEQSHQSLQKSLQNKHQMIPGNLQHLNTPSQSLHQQQQEHRQHKKLQSQNLITTQQQQPDGHYYHHYEQHQQQYYQQQQPQQPLESQQHQPIGDRYRTIVPNNLTQHTNDAPKPNAINQRQTKLKQPIYTKQPTEVLSQLPEIRPNEAKPVRPGQHKYANSSLIQTKSSEGNLDIIKTNQERHNTAPVTLTANERAELEKKIQVMTRGSNTDESKIIRLLARLGGLSLGETTAANRSESKTRPVNSRNAMFRSAQNEQLGGSSFVSQKDTAKFSGVAHTVQRLSEAELNSTALSKSHDSSAAKYTILPYGVQYKDPVTSIGKVDNARAKQKLEPNMFVIAKPLERPNNPIGQESPELVNPRKPVVLQETHSVGPGQGQLLRKNRFNTNSSNGVVAGITSNVRLSNSHVVSNQHQISKPQTQRTSISGVLTRNSMFKPSYTKNGLPRTQMTATSRQSHSSGVYPATPDISHTGPWGPLGIQVAIPDVPGRPTNAEMENMCGISRLLLKVRSLNPRAEAHDPVCECRSEPTCAGDLITDPTPEAASHCSGPSYGAGFSCCCLVPAGSSPPAPPATPKRKAGVAPNAAMLAAEKVKLQKLQEQAKHHRLRTFVLEKIDAALKGLAQAGIDFNQRQAPSSQHLLPDLLGMLSAPALPDMSVIPGMSGPSGMSPPDMAMVPPMSGPPGIPGPHMSIDPGMPGQSGNSGSIPNLPGWF